jgi:hypothetical protein
MGREVKKDPVVWTMEVSSSLRCGVNAELIERVLEKVKWAAG